jgi:hypothetical protein
MAGNNADFEMGGNYARFDPVVSQYNASGELFRIEGHCQSSCTLFRYQECVHRPQRHAVVSLRA